MAASQERVINLLMRKLEGETSEEENAELESWAEANPELYQELADQRLVMQEAFRFSETKQEVRSRLEAKIPELTEDRGSRLHISYWPRYAAAAVLLFCILVAALWSHYSAKDRNLNFVAAIDQKRDIPAPTGHKTMLKLSNGSVIDLDSARNGSLAKEGNAAISKKAPGEINYSALVEKQQEIVYNTISTQRGGEYQVVLADGSKVWLNSESSLRYPTSFSGKERTVELTGEGYFEVSKNASNPFKVRVADGSEVEVLGTHFNVNSYGNEPRTVTTLLEGSVKLTKGSKSKILKPGQQASVLAAGDIELKEGDTESATAWKDGLFRFRSADIETVMRAIARWYDVEVRYEGGRSGNLLTAQVKRNHNASDVLKVLEISGYHFKIDERTIIVMP